MAIIKLKKNSSISNCEEEVVKDTSNEQLENEWNDPSIVFEGEEYKNEYTNHYILNDGTSKLIISSEEKNYFDEVYDLNEIELTDEVIDWILSGTDEMLEMLAAMTEEE